MAFNCKVGSALWLDRVNTYRLQIKSMTLHECLAIATKDIKLAQAHGYFELHSARFIKHWFMYEPNDNETPFGNNKRGRVSVYSCEQKQAVCRDFLSKNHSTNKTSLAAFVKNKQANNAKFICRRTVGRWLKDPKANSLGNEIIAFKYNRVPFMLTNYQRRWSLNYALFNLNRNWKLVSFSDEGSYECGDTSRLAAKKRIRYYTTRSRRSEVPQVLRTKWSGLKIQFFVLVDFYSKQLISIEDRHWTDPPVQPVVPLDHVIHEPKFACWNSRHFEKRDCPPRKHRAPKPKNTEDPTQKVGSKQFLKYYAPAIRLWYVKFLKRVKSRTDKQKVYHVHDNSRAWVCNLVQNYFSTKATYVPVYPPGGYYGFKNGYPPNRPDFNVIAEQLIGETKYRLPLKISAMTADPLSIRSPKLLSKKLHEAFNEIPQQYVQKCYVKLDRILHETVECKGDFGLTALGLFKRKKCNKDTEHIDTDQKTERHQEQMLLSSDSDDEINQGSTDRL